MLRTRWMNSLRAGKRREEGQSLLETALGMPLLLGIAFNIINLGYFWFMVLALAAAPRMGAQYSTQGGSASTTTTAPSTASVSNLVYDNVTRGIVGPTTGNTAVRVCSSTSSGGVSGTTHIAGCDTFGPSFGFAACDSTRCLDPEAPVFVLNRVDVEYTVTPLISGSAFNVLLPSSMQFVRHTSMRSLY